MTFYNMTKACHSGRSRWPFLALVLAMGTFLLFVHSLSAVQARPVSYPGGWTTMFLNNVDRHSAHLHYSPTAFMSLGYKAEYWRDEDHQIHALQMNNLLKRWNSKESQANFYLKSGIGAAYSDYGDFDSEWEPAAFTGIATDWEDQRFFVSYENRYTYAGDIRDDFTQSARVGVAPYVGEYGDLHTWLMLEVEHQPEAQEHIVVMPMVRLFKGLHLVEFGASLEGDIMFNWVTRY